MKKKLLMLFVVMLLTSLFVTTSAKAVSGVDVKMFDGKTYDAWGTEPGQQYMVIVSGSTDGVLLNSGWVTTVGGPPATPVLDYSCVWGAAACINGQALGTPAVPQTIYVTVLMKGTVNDPSSYTESFFWPADLGTQYTINKNTNTGPTAITLTSFSAESSTNWLPLVLVVSALAVVSGGLVVIRRRRK